ncbi:hypothetical protein P9112_001904 [Eukaryota sp. TZLM1-RC]
MESSVLLDDDNKLRLLDPSCFHQSKELVDELSEFAEQFKNHTTTVNDVISPLSELREIVSRAKIRVLGLRNRKEQLKIDTERRVAMLQLQISARKARLLNLQQQETQLQKLIGQ